MKAIDLLIKSITEAEEIKISQLKMETSISKEIKKLTNLNTQMFFVKTTTKNHFEISSKNITKALPIKIATKLFIIGSFKHNKNLNLFTGQLEYYGKTTKTTFSIPIANISINPSGKVTKSIPLI